MAHASRAKADWACRRHEVSKQLQAYELGEKPVPVAVPCPPKLDGQDAHGHGEQRRAQHQLQRQRATAHHGHSTLPAVIGIGRSFLNNAELLARGVAIIDFPNNDIADQQNGSSRNQGKFFELHPQTQGSGRAGGLGLGGQPAWWTRWNKARHRASDAKHFMVTLLAQRQGRIDGGRAGRAHCADHPTGKRLGAARPRGGCRMRRRPGQNVQTLRQIVTENVGSGPALASSARPRRGCPLTTIR